MGFDAPRVLSTRGEPVMALLEVWHSAFGIRRLELTAWRQAVFCMCTDFILNNSVVDLIFNIRFGGSVAMHMFCELGFIF